MSAYFVRSLRFKRARALVYGNRSVHLLRDAERSNARYVAAGNQTRIQLKGTVTQACGGRIDHAVRSVLHVRRAQHHAEALEPWFHRIVLGDVKPAFRAPRRSADRGHAAGLP